MRRAAVVKACADHRQVEGFVLVGQVLGVDALGDVRHGDLFEAGRAQRLAVEVAARDDEDAHAGVGDAFVEEPPQRALVEAGPLGHPSTRS
jgi:hypothetical protein